MPNDDQAAAKKIKELFNQLSVSQKEDIQQFVNGSLVKRADVERSKVDLADSGSGAKKKNQSRGLVSTLIKLVGGGEGSISADDKPVSNDPLIKVEVEMDKSYQDIQAALVQVRQATASMFSCGRALEQNIERNEEQLKKWKERAELAEQQNDERQLEDAREKAANLSQASQDLRQQLEENSKFSAELGKHLNAMEAFTTRMHTRKSIYLARSKALWAARVVEAIGRKGDFVDGVAEFAEAERVLSEESVRAGLDLNPQALTSDALLSEAIVALKQSTAVIERLENALCALQKQKR